MNALIHQNENIRIRSGWRRPMPIVTFLKTTALLAAFGLLLAGCGGGGGGGASAGAVGALTLPDRVEVTQIDSGSGGAGLGAITRPAAVGALTQQAFAGALYTDSGTDYQNSAKQSFVDDNNNALQMVNDVLGACNQTAYGQFVNAGPYKALVKPVGETHQGQTGGATSATTTESLMEMTVNVTRASNNDPMIVDIWVEEDDGPGNMPMLIRGRFVVSQGVSATYPYGVMQAHFKGNARNNDGSLGAELFTMAMNIGADNGQVTVEYVENSSEGNGMYTSDTQARIVAASDFSTGTAYSYQYEKFGSDPAQESTSYVAFNDSYYKMQQVGGATTVYDKNSFDHRIYRYKLFEYDTGDLVAMTGGFPIELRDGAGNPSGHGYVGYYGLWTPYGMTLSNGDTIYRMGSDEAYQVFKVGGKLIKHTRQSITLQDLAGVEMSMWSGSADTVIAWDTTDQRFEKIGVRSAATNWNVDYSIGDAGTAVTFNDWDGAWCESMRAFFQLGRLYASGQPAPTNSTAIYYYAEEVITPLTAGDVPTTFYYWGPGVGENWGGSPTKKTYTFDPAALVLKDGSGNPILDASADSHLMPMTAADSYNASTWWQAYEAPVYYSWQTGTDEWNQYTTIKKVSDGTYVTFDPPLVMNYTHANANDANWQTGDADVAANGKPFSIEWDGNELHIPWHFDATADEWVPAFNLADGVQMTHGGTTYVVKATEESLVMQEVNASLASDLVIDPGSISAPTFQYSATIADQVGHPSTVADAELKVIKGELVTAN